MSFSQAEPPRCHLVSSLCLQKEPPQNIFCHSSSWSISLVSDGCHTKWGGERSCPTGTKKGTGTDWKRECLTNGECKKKVLSQCYTFVGNSDQNVRYADKKVRRWDQKTWTVGFFCLHGSSVPQAWDGIKQVSCLLVWSKRTKQNQFDVMVQNSGL